MAPRRVMADIVEEFQWVGRELSARGLLTLHSGNLSVRRNGRLFITRTGSMLGYLVRSDVVDTSLDLAKPPHPQASMELPAHLAIYEATGAGAIVHAHPASAIAFSFGTDRIVPVDSEGAMILGEVPVIRARHVVGSPEVARKAALSLRDHRIVVVATHGSFAVGNTLEEALSVTTTLEMSARIAFMVRALRRPARRRGAAETRRR